MSFCKSSLSDLSFYRPRPGRFLLIDCRHPCSSLYLQGACPTAVCISSVWWLFWSYLGLRGSKHLCLATCFTNFVGGALSPLGVVGCWMLFLSITDLSTCFMYRPGSGTCLVARTYCVSLQDLGVSSRAWPVLRVNFILWLQTWLVLKIGSRSLRHLIFGFHGFQFFKFTDAWSVFSRFSPAVSQLPNEGTVFGMFGHTLMNIKI